MSVQFGKWNFENEPPNSDCFDKVSGLLAPYGPDSSHIYSKSGVKILYRAFHTTKESRREMQPHTCGSGAVITWDGRLDNRAELIRELQGGVTSDSTDVAIVAAAYEKWSNNCLAKLLGDWSLSIWNPNNRLLILAKDPLGTRHLYYSFDKNQVAWSTLLDPLVLFAGKTFDLNEEYIAGWLADFPDADLTPYIGVHAVPPSSSVLIQSGKHLVTKYWDFDPGKIIRYRTDSDYEEHFRTVLGTAVQRRLRSDAPVLAELSGGMDSSSIVCMADIVIARGEAETPRLDTISWYDDSYDDVEQDWNERRYFTKVEEKRGRKGYQVNVRELRTKGICWQQRLESEGNRLTATPPLNTHIPELSKFYAAHMQLEGHRVVLSGIGGGEATGDGVPTPKPELQDLMARGRLFMLAHQLKRWSMKMRKPQLPLLWEAIRDLLPLSRIGPLKDLDLAPWFESEFTWRNRKVFRGYSPRVKPFGSRPSFQGHLQKLESNRRFLAFDGLRQEFLRETRYPYFDRDFLEFMYSIPPEQIVRPGQRRSLMKRALAGVVPGEVLCRRRKTFIPQTTVNGNSTEWMTAMEATQQMVCSSLGIVDAKRFRQALQKAEQKEEFAIGRLIRTWTLELWLRHLTNRRVTTLQPPTRELGCSWSPAAK
jgi:asparagine synthase (glutamine-hydrolysing)